MDLWVRSQKGLVLKKLNELMIEHKAGENIYFITDGRSCVLGEYETNERAVEVLDEIQSRMIQNECLKTMMPKVSNIKGEEEKFGELFKEMVYEMPEE